MRINFGSVYSFQENVVPSGAKLVGYAALVQAFSIQAPVRRPSCVSEKHVRGSRQDRRPWSVFDRRYWPGDDFGTHLSFAFRHEPIDLLVLKRVFNAIEPDVMAQFVRSAPNGVPNRRAWFFYELLTGRALDVPDSSGGITPDALDASAYFTIKPQLSRRHRVRNNLLGNTHFCPIIRRTPALMEFVSRDMESRAKEIIGRTRAQLITRAASFMLLADSRASFEIEGERPPRGRLERWGRAVIQAGRTALTLDEIIRLHGVLIEDRRFVHVGLRPDGVFLGERDHDGDPLPEFVGARPSDLPDLIAGLLEVNNRMRSGALDPVLQATATAFGFVYIHPFQDGNGRLHRWLIHHVFAERKFTPPGMVFPVSSVMFDRLDQYRETLRAHSAPLMHFIDWHPTPKKNVEVSNDTSDLYRYVDCTEAAEFLYGCVERTIEHDWPQEIDYLRRHDEAVRRIMDTVEMPDHLAENVVRFVRENKGVLGKQRRKNEFSKLTDAEVTALETIVRDTFEDVAES